MIKGPSFGIIDLKIIRENGFEVKAYTWKRTLKPIGLWLLFSFSQRRRFSASMLIFPKTLWRA
jgi:hypothetical protein